MFFDAANYNPISDQCVIAEIGREMESAAAVDKSQL